MRWILLLAALGGSAEWAAAQSAPLVTMGSRVRLRLLSPSGSHTPTFDGTVEAVAGDTLTLRPRAGGNTRLYTPALDIQLYVLSGSRSSILRGGAIGGAIGMLAGGLWGLVRQQECAGDTRNLCINRKPLAFKEGIVVTLSGAVLGLAFGALDRREVWTRAWMPVLETAPASFSEGPGLNLGFSFAF
jgi:hypothetical protein